MIDGKKIRASARGQDCTIQLPGCSPGPDNETVVLAHYQAPKHGSMGGKPHDSSAAYACSSCHDALDRRTKWPIDIRQDMTCREMYENGREWYWFRGMRRTWQLIVDNKVLK
jgi:hypothetical protein